MSAVSIWTKAPFLKTELKPSLSILLAELIDKTAISKSSEYFYFVNIFSRSSEIRWILTFNYLNPFNNRRVPISSCLTSHLLSSILDKSIVFEPSFRSFAFTSSAVFESLELVSVDSASSCFFRSRSSIFFCSSAAYSSVNS